ncbi:ComEA family DNA-binding protein [Streptomyces ferrugineus]|uniref:ComEA family DNA-binding protein n=1 Tax=Streptomyces ferrugineus TaxID=1413221 RepID=A0A7M2SQX8_9ACTN|nr:ComEA family DNA-binding protein [Streptomyces ferrugineus]QOV38379.1 ComEA family DNA-binding protein [Streptomyces ferrugineus]
MALRSHTHAATPTRRPAVTSGPGRGPYSDGRARRRRGAQVQGRARQRHASAEELRRRTEVIFAEHSGEWRESGAGPSGRAEGAPVAAAVDRGGEAELHPDADADADAGAGDAGADVGTGRRRSRAGLALRERMPVWLQARCGLERRGVVALTVVLVVAAGFAVQHFWAGRAQSVRAPEVVRAAAQYGGGQGAGEELGGAAGAGAAATGAPGAVGTPVAEIVVDVSGKVREPGIHRLPAGSRVADALRAAGGVRPGTNTDGLNRARFLVDGEQVIVGAPAAVPGAAPGVGSGGAAVPDGAPAASVALNTATVEQLDTLPGVGPVLAQHIIDYRTQHGGFRSVDELREVNGIGDRRFADLRNLVRP